MKRFALLCLVLALFCGCSANSADLDRAMALRGKLQQSEVRFDVDITADYGDKIHTFSMECHADSKGNLKFTVAKPESITGLSGTVTRNDGKLTFDDQVLAFDILADDLISPVSGPWVMMETLRGGY